tara:strand:- start:559 stop:726 length:168 start_codon:yes stop_codon:yes gene_type:complete
MKLKATSNGTWPAWCHWFKGDVREIKVEKGAEVPAWLVQVKEPAKKAKKKADPEG